MPRLVVSTWFVAFVVPLLVLLAGASFRYVPWWQVAVFEMPFVLLISALLIARARRVRQARRAGAPVTARQAWWFGFGLPVATLVWGGVLIAIDVPRSHHNPLTLFGATGMMCCALGTLLTKRRPMPQ